jgi:formamidopyrimidine-DNA glycosylase
MFTPIQVDHVITASPRDALRHDRYFRRPLFKVTCLSEIGWLNFRDEHTYYYKPKKAEEVKEWPPKYWKFMLETEGEPKLEAAFTDTRRFSRIRLVDCAAKDIRNTTPLKENGPDPVIDKQILTEEWLTQKMKCKHVPVKALLLDQANISGIGNWVG